MGYPFGKQWKHMTPSDALELEAAVHGWLRSQPDDADACVFTVKIKSESIKIKNMQKGKYRAYAAAPAVATVIGQMALKPQLEGLQQLQNMHVCSAQWGKTSSFATFFEEAEQLHHATYTSGDAEQLDANCPPVVAGWVKDVRVALSPANIIIDGRVVDGGELCSRFYDWISSAVLKDPAGFFYDWNHLGTLSGFTGTMHDSELKMKLMFAVFGVRVLGKGDDVIFDGAAVATVVPLIRKMFGVSVKCEEPQSQPWGLPFLSTTISHRDAVPRSTRPAKMFASLGGDKGDLDQRLKAYQLELAGHPEELQVILQLQKMFDTDTLASDWLKCYKRRVPSAPCPRVWSDTVKAVALCAQL